jgi:hypothetical protein
MSTSLASRPPFSICPTNGTSSHGDAGQTVSGIPANYIGNGSGIHHTTQHRYKYFNVHAFGRPLKGSFGNTGRTVIRRPGIHEWDLSLYKNFRLTERMNVQLCWETSNSLNHTQWAGMNTGLSLPNLGLALVQTSEGTFGEVTDTRDSRARLIAIRFLLIPLLGSPMLPAPSYQ